MIAGASPRQRVRRALTLSRHAAPGYATSAPGLGSARGLSLPDFLGIGAQKAGTTWLWANLRCYPELYLPEPKELHFFDRHCSDGLAEYSLYFSEAAGRVKGEITPAYSFLPENRVQFIRSVMPEVRLVFVVRNPIERAWVAAMMALVYKIGRSVEEVNETELLGDLGSRGSLKRGDYVRTLDTWLSVFPREQLFVGFFEDLRECPQDLLRRIFEFLGVTTAVDWGCFPYKQVVRPASEVQLPGASPPIPEKCERFVRELYADQLAELSVRFGARVVGWRRGHLHRRARNGRDDQSTGSFDPRLVGTSDGLHEK